MGLGLARLPGRNGFVSVVPSYRLKTQHSDHVEDLTAVLRWVRDHIHAYGGDPSQIILSGHSAGGYLASFLGVSPNLLRERGLDPSVIKGVVCLSGIYWLPNPFDPDTKVSSGWYNSVFQRVYVRGTFGANMDRLRELSPLHRVASRKTADNAGTGAASTGQLPSFLVMNATSDLGLGVDGDRFHLALESAGTKVRAGAGARGRLCHRLRAPSPWLTGFAPFSPLCRVKVARHVLEGHDHATITRSKAALEVINNFLVGVLPARCSGA